MAETSTGRRIVFATRDRLLGDALAIACQRHGLRVDISEPGVTWDSASLVDLDEVDMALRVGDLVDALLEGRSIGRSTVTRSDTAPSLTDREQEVCRELARGGSRAEVAAVLGISEHTVRTHLQNIFAKLGVRDQAELVAWTFATNGHEPGGGA